MSKKINLKKTIEKKRKINFILTKFKFFINVFLLFAIIVIYFFGRDFLKNIFYDKVIDYSSKLGLTTKKIIVSGSYNLDINELVAVSKIVEGKPILKYDLNEIKEKIEKIDWVESALVERRLPDTIYLAILERKPVARWQNNYKIYLLDIEGNIINSQNISKFSNLIHVVGSDAPFYIETLINDLKAFPDLESKVKIAVRFGERRWNLTLEKDLIVKMPEKNFSKALTYLQKIYAEKLLDAYKLIDLRDENKYYFEKK